MTKGGSLWAPFYNASWDFRRYLPPRRAPAEAVVRRRTTRHSATTPMRFGAIIAPLRRSESPQMSPSRAGAARIITRR